MSRQLYVKEFPEKSEDQRFLGVIVDVNDGADTGEVLDAMFASAEVDLLAWFNASTVPEL